MSLIIYKPENKKLPKHLLEKCFSNDSDGIGFCFADNGQITIKKVFKNFDSFYEEFLPHENKSCIINFVTTEFIGCKRNVGPFVITEKDKNFVLAHVGQVWKRAVIENHEESQTSNLIRLIKKMFFPAAFGKEYFQWLIEEALPFENRIIIFNNLGEVQIFNKKKGVEMHDCWFSESPYKQSSLPYNHFSHLKECCICHNKFASTYQVGVLTYCFSCDKIHNNPAKPKSNILPFEQSARPEPPKIHAGDSFPPARIPSYLQNKKLLPVNEFLNGLVNPVGCVDVFDVV